MKNITFLKNNLFAHRGLHNLKKGIPENSYPAFEQALIYNYGIEVDINFLSDKTIVCFHDNNLVRSSKLNKEIKDLTKNDLNDILLFNTNEKIPLFKNLLSLVNGKVPLLIEIKSHKNFKNTLPLFCELMDQYNGEFAVFSFNPFIVNWFKKNKPNYIRGQITSYFEDNQKMPFFLKYLMKSMFFNKFTKPDFISYNYKNLPNKYVDREKDKGVLILSYTATNQKQLDDVLSNYDNIVFENFIPDVNSLK